MPISHKNEIIFIHIPKNAGTSIEKALKMSDTGHKPWSYYYKKYSNEWKTYKKLAVFRNPIDRLISCYNYAKMENSYWHSVSGNSIYGKHPDYDFASSNSIEVIIDGLSNRDLSLHHPGWDLQSKWITSSGHLMVSDLVMIENLSDWFEANSLPILDSLNKSKKAQTLKNRICSNKQILDKIEKIYQQDFIIYNRISNERK